MRKASELRKEHAKRHRRASRRIAAAIRPFFIAQTQWILDGISVTEPLTPESIGIGFDVGKATEDLLGRLAVLELIAEESAEAVFAQFSQPVKLEQKLFGWIKDVIKRAIGLVLGADWWPDVASGGVKAAKDIIAKTIAKSGPIPIEDIPKVKAKLGTKLRKIARHRVKTIAEAEANGAINAGASAAGEAVSQTTGLGDGERVAGDTGETVDRKFWITMLDERVRGAHSVLHKTGVPVGSDFNVGGYPAPHPGYAMLPIGLRIHCRCFLTFQGVEEDLDFPLPDEVRVTV